MTVVTEEHKKAAGLRMEKLASVHVPVVHKEDSSEERKKKAVQKEELFQKVYDNPKILFDEEIGELAIRYGEWSMSEIRSFQTWCKRNKKDVEEWKQRALVIIWGSGILELHEAAGALSYFRRRWWPGGPKEFDKNPLDNYDKYGWICHMRYNVVFVACGVIDTIRSFAKGNIYDVPKQELLDLLDAKERMVRQSFG
jgi:hypothetical protein